MLLEQIRRSSTVRDIVPGKNLILQDVAAMHKSLQRRWHRLKQMISAAATGGCAILRTITPFNLQLTRSLINSGAVWPASEIAKHRFRIVTGTAPGEGAGSPPPREINIS